MSPAKAVMVSLLASPGARPALPRPRLSAARATPTGSEVTGSPGQSFVCSTPIPLAGAGTPGERWRSCTCVESTTRFLPRWNLNPLRAANQRRRAAQSSGPPCRCPCRTLCYASLCVPAEDGANAELVRILVLIETGRVVDIDPAARFNPVRHVNLVFICKAEANSVLCVFAGVGGVVQTDVDPVTDSVVGSLSNRPVAPTPACPEPVLVFVAFLPGRTAPIPRACGSGFAFAVPRLRGSRRLMKDRELTSPGT